MEQTHSKHKERRQHPCSNHPQHEETQKRFSDLSIIVSHFHNLSHNINPCKKLLVLYHSIDRIHYSCIVLKKDIIATILAYI